MSFKAAVRTKRPNNALISHEFVSFIVEEFCSEYLFLFELISSLVFITKVFTILEGINNLKHSAGLSTFRVLLTGLCLKWTIFRCCDLPNLVLGLADHIFPFFFLKTLGFGREI